MAAAQKTTKMAAGLDFNTACDSLLHPPIPVSAVVDGRMVDGHLRQALPVGRKDRPLLYPLPYGTLDSGVPPADAPKP